jgi:hypothetical protein
MKVKMKVQVSGTRNGARWPEPGKTIDVSADEAKQLIAAKLAEEPSTAKKPTAKKPTEPKGEQATAVPDGEVS